MNLSSFDTSSVIELNSLFNECKSLTSIDVSNFNTSKCENMGHMFYRCTSLISLDLSCFDTHNTLYLDNMFKECSNLENLNIKNFNISKAKKLQGIFDGLTSLKSLDLSHFIIGSATNMDNIFTNINNSNLEICIKEEREEQKQLLQSILNSYSNINFTNNCAPNNTGTDSQGIISTVIIDINSNIVENISSIITPDISSTIILNNSSTITSDINSTISSDISSIITSDISSTITSDISSIITSDINSTISSDISSNITSDISSTISLAISSTISSIDQYSFIELFHNLSLIKNNEPKNLELVYDIIKSSIAEELIYELLKKNEDLIIKEQNSIFQITTPENQNINVYNNLSTIILEDCENILKEKYNIPKNESLIILKVDSFLSGFNIPIVKYDIFNPITKEVLDLNICNNIKIAFPVSKPIEENNIFYIILKVNITMINAFLIKLRMVQILH